MNRRSRSYKPRWMSRICWLVLLSCGWLCPAMPQVEGYSGYVENSETKEVYACSETSISADLAYETYDGVP